MTLGMATNFETQYQRQDPWGKKINGYPDIIIIWQTSALQKAHQQDVKMNYRLGENICKRHILKRNHPFKKYIQRSLKHVKNR